MSRDVAVIQLRRRADFGQCEEVVSFFIGLFCKEKGPFGFLGALSLSKSPKSQKGPFSNKTYRYNDTTSRDWENLRAEPWMTAIVGDIVEARGSNPKKAQKSVEK